MMRMISHAVECENSIRPTTTTTTTTTTTIQDRYSTENKMLNQVRDLPRTRRRQPIKMIPADRRRRIVCFKSSSSSSSAATRLCLITTTTTTTARTNTHQSAHFMGLLLIFCPLLLLLSGGTGPAILTKYHGSHQHNHQPLLVAATSSASNLSPVQCK